MSSAFGAHEEWRVIYAGTFVMGHGPCSGILAGKAKGKDHE
jgi:hypothetical protein